MSEVDGGKKRATFSPLQSNIPRDFSFHFFVSFHSQFTMKTDKLVRNNYDHQGCCLAVPTLMDDNIMTDDDFHDDGSLPGGASQSN